jgi:hypothetical protein
MKIKPKSYVKLEPKSRAPYLRRTDGGMIKIVKEIESGLISIRTTCLKYGLYRDTLKLFITKFSIRTLGDEFSNQILSRMNDDQKESALNKKIQQLTKDLEYLLIPYTNITTKQNILIPPF